MAMLTPIAVFFGQLLYRVMRLAPVRRKVVFLSRQSDEPSRDFRMLADELRRLDPPPEIVTRCKRVPESFGGRLAYVGEIVAQMHELATASVCVIDGHILPVSLLSHRPGLIVVQLWHALGAIKGFGHQAVGLPGGRSAALARTMKMHRNYDVVVCGGAASVPVFAAAFGVPEGRVMPVGLPRVDYLLEENAADASRALESLARRFPVLNDAARTRVLYAPTFRRGAATAFAEVADAFSGGAFTLLVKPHDLEAHALEAEHVVDATGADTLDLIKLADVVVTDYSAIAFEAAVLDKPLFFLVGDIEDYAERHGLNIDPRTEFPGLTFADPRALAERIAVGDYTYDAVRAFKERYVPSGAGCTKAIADIIAEHLPNP